MKKRHEIIALLAATAGLGMTTAADAAMTQILKHPTEEVLSGQEALSDQSLSRMIQLAEAKGHDRSGESNAGGNSKSPQGNGNARGFDNSHNSNAAGSPDKRGKGEGENDDDDDDDDDGDGHDHGKGHGRGHDHHNPS